MNLKSLIKELEEKEIYKKFLSENEGSYFTACFNVLDLHSNSTNITLDFYIPKLKKIASFEFPFNEFKLHPDEIFDAKKQSLEIEIDLDELRDICESYLEKKKVKIKFSKIIAILQNDIWNLTCMDDFLNVVRLKINAFSGEEIHFEKASLIDFGHIRKV